MTDHGMASIALCECYGMTGDKAVGKAAQAALDYIVASQDPEGGGWRYMPQTPDEHVGNRLATGGAQRAASWPN